MRPLSTINAIATGLASQARNAREASQSVLAGRAARSGGAGVALVATMTARAHRARSTGDTWLLLKLLYFRRQSICQCVRRCDGRQ